MIYRTAEGWERKSIAELELPSSIKDTIERRLERLSPGCQEMLRIAALLGKQFRFDELTAVLERSEADLLDLLDEALKARLVQALESETFQFSHDKIREVLYLEQNPVRRRVLHRQCAERLEALHAGSLAAYSGRLAYHFYHAGEHARALPYARQAADRATALFAPEEALGYCGRRLSARRRWARTPTWRMSTSRWVTCTLCTALSTGRSSITSRWPR